MLFPSLTMSWRPSWPCCRGPSCCSSQGTPPPLSPFAQNDHFSHLELISGFKTSEKRRILQPAVLPHVLLQLVHLVAQQGCVRDPKCGTKIKSRYLTGIQWWWSQVSRMPNAQLFFVRKTSRSRRFLVSSTRPGEENKWFDPIPSIFGHVLSWL